MDSCSEEAPEDREYSLKLPLHRHWFIIWEQQLWAGRPGTRSKMLYSTFLLHDHATERPSTAFMKVSLAWLFITEMYSGNLLHPSYDPTSQLHPPTWTRNFQLWTSDLAVNCLEAGMYALMKATVYSSWNVRFLKLMFCQLELRILSTMNNS